MLVLLAALYWAILHQRGLHLAPLCVARNLGRCEHVYLRWGGHTGKHCARHTGFYHRVGASMANGLRPFFLFPVPVWGFSLRPGLAVQSPTRSAVPRSSNPDVTLDLGLIWTNVNLLPSGAMNRSNAPPAVPVQSALTVYVPDSCTLREMCPLALLEETVSTLPLPSKTS